ncbi:MAG: SDR family NAD(P)-dependent oxidoreductase [Alphaproteobacteria bacterium]|nr:SDR family NAD(P)-dependent oxidoreductase [Alphaproteobacteria bacterium]
MSKFSHILITGASSGIGEALALHYASKGTKLLSICGRNEERLEIVAKICRQKGCEVETKILDVTNKEDVHNWIIESNKKMPLNLVFANAGVATLQETTENVHRTFNINVMGIVNTILPTIEIFKQAPLSQTKHIAITSSIAGYHGMPTCPSYSASKACIKAWGEGLRLNLKDSGINVSTICPGFVRSRITDKNTCPMPFFMEADKAAQIIASNIEKNIGLISFPWQMRFATWLGSILPNRISDFIYSKLPYKV